MTPLDWTFSVAPMMGWTDRHERYFLRLLSKRMVLYTEMIAAGAAVHGDPKRFLAFNPEEHPVALQVGGSDVERMTKAAVLGEKAGFDEININIGCPSERGTHRLFGAHLMKHPELVAEVFESMAKAVKIPVTIKTRIGVDRDDSYEPLVEFVERQAQAGCTVFHIHARKAWLDGLSPKENRDVPPLHYDFVYRLKKERPDLTVTLNGGVKTLQECQEHLQHCDGVMMGREAYHNPFLLSEVDTLLYGESENPSTAQSRDAFLDAAEEYIERELAKGTRFHSMVKHLLGIHQGLPGARAWRRHLSVEGCKVGAGIATFRAARQIVSEAQDKAREHELESQAYHATRQASS